MKKLRVLIACEESQRVCAAFRELGHEAYSCDIQEPSGGHPKWHIQDDALKVINPKKRFGTIVEGISFYTIDGEFHTFPGRWDMIIAHPPCTDLAVSGARHFEQKQKDGRQQKAIVFFMQMALANCDHVAVENPVCIMSSAWRKPDQIIQPYQFGEHARKATCLWLKGLPLLEPTDIVDPGEIVKGGFSVGASLNYARDENGKIISWNDPRTAKVRSKTFPGIAKAMAEQWSKYLSEFPENT